MVKMCFSLGHHVPEAAPQSSPPLLPEEYCTVLYCRVTASYEAVVVDGEDVLLLGDHVLHCTVLYCTVLYCIVLTS